MIAFSVGAHPSAYTTDNGVKMPMAVVKSTSLFWNGLGIMIIGFILSITYCVTEYVYGKKENKW